MKSQDFVDTDLLTSSRGAVDVPQNFRPGMSQGRVDLDARVEQARQQMLELRRQQEDLERERQELEELRRREEEFEEGKIRMLEELNRTVSTIEQEEFELNKKNALLGNFREVYQDYVRQLQDIRENEWTSDDLKTQLTKAFAVLDAGRAELNKGRAQLDFLESGPIPSAEEIRQPAAATLSTAPEEFDFVLEVKRGLARSLPFIIFAAVALLIFKMAS